MVRDVLVDGGETSLRAPKIVSDGDKIQLYLITRLSERSKEFAV